MRAFDDTKTVRIRPHLHIKCKAAAEDRNIRMQDWLEEVLEKHFKERNEYRKS